MAIGEVRFALELAQILRKKLVALPTRISPTANVDSTHRPLGDGSPDTPCSSVMLSQIGIISKEFQRLEPPDQPEPKTKDLGTRSFRELVRAFMKGHLTPELAACICIEEAYKFETIRWLKAQLDEMLKLGILDISTYTPKLIDSILKVVTNGLSQYGDFVRCGPLAIFEQRIQLNKLIQLIGCNSGCSRKFYSFSFPSTEAWLKHLTQVSYIRHFDSEATTIKNSPVKKYSMRHSPRVFDLSNSQLESLFHRYQPLYMHKPRLLDFINGSVENDTVVVNKSSSISEIFGSVNFDAYPCLLRADLTMMQEISLDTERILILSYGGSEIDDEHFMVRIKNTGEQPSCCKIHDVGETMSFLTRAIKLSDQVINGASIPRKLWCLLTRAIMLSDQGCYTIDPLILEALESRLKHQDM